MATTFTRDIEGNYLRVRGEYLSVGPAATSMVELPPRARRIRVAPTRMDSARGTTSACAENTHAAEKPNLTQWNYLRVRGEYVGCWCYQEFHNELPPRARRIP